jgi:transcriptional regulator with XRE-family HTH domain
MNNLNEYEQAKKNNLKNLRKHINTYRGKNKIYQRELSVQLGFHQNYVTNILNGYQGISTNFLNRLGEKIGLDLSEIKTELELKELKTELELSVVETKLDVQNHQEATNDE